jgi:hypothetical protein
MGSFSGFVGSLFVFHGWFGTICCFISQIFKILPRLALITRSRRMATNLERMQIMMEEIGPAMPEIEAVIQSEEKNWAIQFEDQSIVMLEWAENPDRVVLTAMLGAPSESMQLSVYETLLCYNLLWKDTGGVKMALSGPAGELVLLYELFASNLNRNELQTVLINFVSISQVWSVYVTGEGDQQVSNLPSPTDMLHLGA